MKWIFLLVLMFPMFAGAVYGDECISGDCLNGQGTKTFPDGREKEGQWEYGEFIGE